ncbi:MAG: hypothetical protein AMJ53_05135 [Gammaproteobacteria bacterium SG8_11]|nr:MAG: hypothetical protein AMJ53_05135 [Gammaproteobacteria bacterium SG8_11]
MLFQKQAIPYVILCSTIAVGACSSSSDPAPADSTAPTFNGVTTATASGGTNIVVTWDAASDNTTSASDIEYRIYASLDMNDKGTVRDSVVGVTSHTVKYLEPGMTYFITVEAVDEAGNSNSNNAQLSDTTDAEVSLQYDIQPTLQAACATSGCHDAATQSHGANFSSASATYASLVDVDNHHCGGIGAKRVVAGDAANSQILNILDWGLTPCIVNGGTAALQMPEGGAELDHEFIHFFEHWITDGAQNN